METLFIEEHQITNMQENKHNSHCCLQFQLEMLILIKYTVPTHIAHVSPAKHEMTVMQMIKASVSF